MGVRATPKEECGVSAAEAVFGVPLTLPGQEARLAEAEEQPVITVRQRTYVEVALLHPRLRYVLVRQGQKSRRRESVFDGPYAIRSWSGKYYEILMGDKCESLH
jgi:hypothetical protein